MSVKRAPGGHRIPYCYILSLWISGWAHPHVPQYFHIAARWQYFVNTPSLCFYIECLISVKFRQQKFWHKILQLTVNAQTTHMNLECKLCWYELKAQALFTNIILGTTWIDKFTPHIWACDYFTLLGLKLMCVRKYGPWSSNTKEMATDLSMNRYFHTVAR